MAAVISFRFPSEPAFEQLAGCSRVSEVRAAILERRPTAHDALHGNAGLAASGWKLLLTDAASKTEYTDDAATVPPGTQLVVQLIKARASLHLVVSGVLTHDAASRHAQEYVVRAPKSSRRVFLGRFPAGKPGLAGVGAGAGWELSRVESDAGGPALLHLVGGAGLTTLVGTPETSQTAPYYLFMMRQEGVIDAVPSGPWYTFRPELRPRGALSLEEAEARMKARSRATETAGNWLARAGGAAAATRALPVGAGDDGGGAGGDSDSDAVRRGAGSEEDSEEEEAPRKRRSKGAKGGGAEAAAADGGAEVEGEEPEAAAAHDDGRRRGGGGGESPDHGEDWEHERAMTDDDEAVGVGDQIEEQEEALPPPAAAEADAAEEGLDEEGQKMRKLLLAQRKGEGVEEEDNDDDGDLFEDDEAFEDEDFMDPDTDTRLSKLLGMRKAADAAAAATETGAAPQRAKRPRSPEADAAPGAAVPPPAKAQRVMSEAAAAELAAMEASCGITLVQLTEALTPPVPVTDLMKRFKRNLKTESAKTAFKELLRRYARVENGKMCLK